MDPVSIITIEVARNHYISLSADMNYYATRVGPIGSNGVIVLQVDQIASKGVPGMQVSQVILLGFQTFSRSGLLASSLAEPYPVKTEEEEGTRNDGAESSEEAAAHWSNLSSFHLSFNFLDTGSGFQSRMLHLSLYVNAIISVLFFGLSNCLMRGNETDRLALLEFKYLIREDPSGVFDSWNSTIHFCKWHRITCSPRHQRVTIHDLQSLKLLGSISSHIGNLSFLRELNLLANEFDGKIPPEIGSLKRLEKLRLYNNSLSGAIPPNLSYCSELTLISLAKNQRVGEIPVELALLTKLQLLVVQWNYLPAQIPYSVNQFSGPVPSLAKLQASEVSYLEQLPRDRKQSITGEIPSGIGNFVNMVFLSMQINRISGGIPSSIGGLRGLVRLYLDCNQFTGNLPSSIGNLTLLKDLSLCSNFFQGGIPPSLGMLKFVSFRDLGNNFQGSILPSLSSLKVLHELDLSRNNLSGEIPSFLEKLNMLQVLNLSHNHLESPVPASGIFKNASAISISGNDELCRGSVVLHLPKCIVKEPKKRKLNRTKRRGPSSSSSFDQSLLAVSYHSLVKATYGFSGASLLSVEAFGSVYKGMIAEGENRIIIAVKRLRIATDVASALDYLPHHCETPIVHCDLKPNNIFLDSEMVAHVGDFGLARFIQEAADELHANQSSTICIRGLTGYVAPEYGMGSEVSTLGDVYSYGILLLELFTGKRPTDKLFNEGLNNRNFTERALSGQLEEIIDTAVFQEGQQTDQASRYNSTRAWTSNRVQNA
ncbi:putative receptor-like protein kinase At3g47110 [Punica granatum]|uniref:non-specific serine/threonine protein kinase n=1 Tax=Punica granatum TaxID=22663 RepID=A0A6P8C6P0_PUNGR|nr:putative receptor-like protein kinase At3g47110 [Punica granatum]